MEEFSTLCRFISYDFKDPSLLKSALTHPSAPQGPGPCQYERLEFLGDRVLGLCIAEMLFERFPEEEEGALARRLAILCGRETLEKVGRSWQLEKYVIAIGTEKDAPNIIADACEAILGAIFLESDFEIASAVIKHFWQGFLEDELTLDAKTTLQHFLQSKGLGLPAYKIIDRSGPEHKPIFTIEAQVEELYAVGQGSSRKAAEQRAAANLFKKLMEP